MKDFPKKEARKAKKPLVTLESLGFKGHARLTTPKKTDKQALKRIASGELFWDRKKKERAAKKSRWVNVTPETHASTKRHGLPMSLRKQMLSLMESWVWSETLEAFAIADDKVLSVEIFDELLDAAIELPYAPTALKVVGITELQREELLQSLPEGSAVEIV